LISNASGIKTRNEMIRFGGIGHEYKSGRLIDAMVAMKSGARSSVLNSMVAASVSRQLLLRLVYVPPPS
jgi:hypothetical protein